MGEKFFSWRQYWWWCVQGGNVLNDLCPFIFPGSQLWTYITTFEVGHESLVHIMGKCKYVES